MLSVLQICLLSLVGILAVASIVFMIMFIVEISVKQGEKVKKIKIKKVKKDKKKIIEEDTQISVDDMLENLEKQSQEGLIIEEVADVQDENIEAENSKETEVEEVEIIIEEEPIEEIAEETVEEISAEEIETAEDVVEDIENVVAEEIVEVEKIVEDEEKVDVEEAVETEEIVEDLKIEDLAATLDDEDDDISDDDLLAYQQTEPEIVIEPGAVIDYKARLDKLVLNKVKLEKDLQKIQKFILKYERTDRRKSRNQKMLDRRAGELTNLNLVMYSVTDIKNVDEEKKVKQEELTAHIAELKASIQDADEYLESNKEKYEHNIKMAKFLTQERTRYIEEIAELEILVKKEDSNN